MPQICSLHVGAQCAVEFENVFHLKPATLIVLLLLLLLLMMMMMMMMIGMRAQSV